MEPITWEQLNAWNEAFKADPKRQLAAMSLSKTKMDSVAFVTGQRKNIRRKFSVEIKTLEVTDQKSSGRCWLFAATNVLREMIAKRRSMEKFELSQSYPAFWDKFERCNYFLENIIATAHLPSDDRTVAHILSVGVEDGGQWGMFANIIKKYGMVPKDVYEETYQSSNTALMNRVLNQSLKAGAAKLRGMAGKNAAARELRQAKDEMLGRIYGFLCGCYGEPPREFDFEYVDKDGAYHIEKGYTPQSFAEAYAGGFLDGIVSVIHAPTADKPYHRTFTIKMLGNVAGGGPVKHLNLPMEEMKAAIIRQLEAGKVVWFGSDVSHYDERDMGLWDDKSFDYELLTGLPLSLSKAEGLDYGFSAMDHAMVLTGVNIENGRPARWKIENSWGDEHGEKGYYVCSDSWFDRFVYQAAVEKEYLGSLAELWDLEPIELAPWDPMGTLAD